LKSPAEVFIFFIFKKNNSLYFYINYKNLNKIFIKNYYFLSLILKILNRILRSIYFLKINIKNIYY
ncbi:hypothetical protein BO70DRAFT_287789, partial [Aspergillus heteromorphus CBS 117.55]